MKIGAGSIGETVKVLATSYSNWTEQKDINDKQEIFQVMFLERQMLNRRFNEQGDILLHLEFDDFYNKFIYGEKTNFDAKNDLAVFIFCILFFESEKLRYGFQINDQKTRKNVFEVIHEVSLKYAPMGIKSEKTDFVLYIESLYRLLW